MFVRTKKVAGKEYKQLVENYRAADGGHYQRVIAHLGKHATPEEALEAEREKLVALENGKLWELWRRYTRNMRYCEQNLKGPRWGGHLERYHGGEIPSTGELTKCLGREKGAPKTDEVESVYTFMGKTHTLYKRAVVPIPPEVDEYSRSLASCVGGKVTEREEPDFYGHTTWYDGVYQFERYVREYHAARRRANKKAEEYNRRRNRLKKKIKKLEDVVTKIEGLPEDGA